MKPWFCPHCAMEIARSVSPPPAGRCPACLLVIGRGRATDTPSAEAGERAHSSAAGILRGRAARSDGAVRERDEVMAALREAARAQGCPSVGRLRMLDYAQRAADDPQLPSVADVIATFGGWKAATRMAPESKLPL